jgi:hypothetical protein
MIKRVWNHVGQVAGLLALFIVLGGPAWAASMIDGARIKPSSVTGKQVRTSSLTGSDVRNSSLTGADVKNATIDARDVKDGSLTGTDIADGSIGASDLASGVTPTASSSIPDGSITTAKFASSAIAPRALALPGLRTEQNATSPNLIGGGDGNSVTPGTVGASIGGGGGSGGGEGNTATGSYATVPGGLSNSAGAFSMAAGRRAKAVNTGSFVWADSTNADFSSTADNQFSIRAANGMFIANDAGGAKAVPIGTRYRDNSIAAWARVTAAGGVDSNFNVASVTRVSAGRYSFTLNSSLSSGFSLVPIVTVETDPDGGGNPPVGAANVRLVATNQVAAGNTFDVYIYNGNFALVDNDFQVLVTGR